MRKTSTLLTAAVIAAAAWAPSQAGADVIYHQAFENSSGAVKGPSDYLVSLYANYGATVADDLSGNGMVRPEDTIGTHQSNINAPDPYDNAANGGNGEPLGKIRIGGVLKTLMFTEFNLASFTVGEDGSPGNQPGSVDPSNWSDLTGSINIAHSGGAGATRFAIRVGGTFYVEEAGSPEGTFPTATVDLKDGASLWKELLFTEDVSLGLSADPAVTLSSISGPITAFGIYMNDVTNTIRTDEWDLSGTSVPEPGSLMIGAAGLVLMLRKRG